MGLRAIKYKIKQMLKRKKPFLVIGILSFHHVKSVSIDEIGHREEDRYKPYPSDDFVRDAKNILTAQFHEEFAWLNKDDIAENIQFEIKEG